MTTLSMNRNLRSERHSSRERHRKGAAYICIHRVGGVGGVTSKGRDESFKRQHLHRQDCSVRHTKQSKLLQALTPLPAAEILGACEGHPCSDASAGPGPAISEDMLFARPNAPLEASAILHGMETSHSRYKDVAGLLSMLDGTDSVMSNTDHWSDCNILSSMLKFTDILGRA